MRSLAIRVHVRRDGVEHITKEIKMIEAAGGHVRIERRPVPRNRWRVTAERFRAADRQTAVRDADLVVAQSQMAIIEKALERAFPNDERARHNIKEAARERIAQHLEQGRSFDRGMVMEPVRDRHRPDGDKGDALQTRNGERVRIQEQER